MNRQTRRNVTPEPHQPVTVADVNDAAKERREAEEAAYVDWHYDQFGCAPTTGFGPNLFPGSATEL